jgi:hypothetical protein
MDDVEGVAQPATVGGQSPNWLRFVADPSPVSTATGAAERWISRGQVRVITREEVRDDLFLRDVAHAVVLAPLP